MLSKTALNEFKSVYKEEYGKDISDQKAVELGVHLLTLFNHIYRPLSKSEGERSFFFICPLCERETEIVFTMPITVKLGCKQCIRFQHVKWR